MIILGVDPGLTRCGVGVIEAGAYRRLSFIHVDVVRSDPKTSQDLRLLAIYNGLVEKIERFVPDVVSIERVFAQENRNTVLGTAQAAGLAMLAAAQLRFHRLEGADHSLVFVFPLNGSMNEVSVGFNVYEDASGILRRNPQAAVESGFAVVDAERVLQFFR